MIVDEFTGRVLHGRRFNEGLHQALEAKEGVQVQHENQTLATITLQNYFRLYKKLSGMTGTAQTEAAELHQIYKLGVVPIPTNKPMLRQDDTDYIYKTEDAKFAAVVDDIAERHEAGQPILVGTASVAKSERLASLLLRRGIAHEVLNAKQHDREAAIVAAAGRKGAVTVATNMAGRGTDIMLGGNPEFAADLALRERGFSPDETPEEYEAAWPQALEKAHAEIAKEHDEVVALGGLYVLGTERHDSRRIDNQLRGRSGRQGDPGESRFYLSLGDDLMVKFSGERVASMMNMLRVPEDVPIEAKVVTKSIQSAQSQMEAQNFEIRKDVLKYDDVLNKQRTVIYDERRRILEGLDLSDQIRPMIESVVRSYVEAATSDGYAEEWNLEQLWTALNTLYPVSLTIDEVLAQAGGEKSDLTRELLIEELVEDAKSAYDVREEDLGAEMLRELERRVLLTVIDSKWREHLYEMDYLREGIWLRAMAQRDPLVEYQREGFDMFSAMMDGIQEQSVGLAVPSRGADRGRRRRARAAGRDARRRQRPDARRGDAGRRAAGPRAAARTQWLGPQITAKGLDRSAPVRPLVYSSPSLDTAGPEVRTADPAAGDEGGARSGPPRRGQPEPGQPGQPVEQRPPPTRLTSPARRIAVSRSRR